jgi:hypothetical protein
VNEREHEHGHEQEHEGAGTDPEQSTDEYSPGTPGYFERAELPGEGEGEADATTPFWKRLGFDSYQAYIDYMERQQARLAPGPRRSRVPKVELPGGEVGEIGQPRPGAGRERRERRLRQVNVKLRPSEGEDLDRAARIYALAPTTLARLLVNRGVGAILDDGRGGD